MRYMWKLAMVCLLVLALLASPLLGCGEEDGDGERVTITVGHITDLTGPGSYSLRPILTVWEDLIRYINEEDPIPGAEIKMVSWDTKYDPARDVPGYHWCRDRGAEIIITPQPTTAEVLKPFAERDKVPILTYMATTAMTDPPGWVFCAGMDATPAVKALLGWISEQWPNYPTKIKVGTAGAAESNEITFSKAVKAYCQDHSDKFEFVDGYLVPFATTSWSGEVEKLKDCDYIGSNGAMVMNCLFIKELREVGSTATMFDLDSQPSMRGLMVDMCGWDAIDGKLSFQPWGWWGDPFEVPEVAEELLQRYHLEEADEIIYTGNGYLAVYAAYVFFDILRQAVAEVGAENLDGQAFYDTAIKFNKTYKGLPERGFTETSRYLGKQAVVYEWSAEQEDLVRVSDWLEIE